MGMDRTTIEDATSPLLTFKLPRGFILKNGDETYLLNEATIHEMTGDEEDIIANENQSFTQKVHALVGSSLTSLSDGDGHMITDRKMLMEKVPQKLLMSDLLVSFLRIREVTVGSEVRQKVRCPECTNDEGQPFIFTVILDLSEFEGLPVEGDPLQTIREYTTPRGVKITWEMMDGELELAHEKKKNAKEKATAALLARVRTVNGEPAKKEVLKKMAYVERTAIRKQFDQEGGIETDFDCKCRNCGYQFKVPLEIGGTDFFSPSETSDD
jgi:predicted Zn-ribbon and HTH transcriptional regulator